LWRCEENRSAASVSGRADDHHQGKVAMVAISRLQADALVKLYAWLEQYG